MSDERPVSGTAPSDTTHLHYLGGPAPDDPWSPDYTGVRPVADVAAPPRRLRVHVRSIAAGVVAVSALVVLVAAFAVADRRSPSRQFSATRSGRLPETIVERWSVRSTSVVDSSTLVLVDDAIVHQSSKQPFSDVIAIDLATGWPRWIVPGDQIGNMRLVGPFADEVVVLQAFDAEASLIGLAASNGEQLWSYTPVSRSIAGALSGSDLIAVTSTTDEDATSFVDPLTGIEVGAVTGSPLANDLNGCWYFRDRNGVVSQADLRDRWHEPTVVGTLGQDARPAAVGGHLLTATDRIRFVDRPDDVSIRDARGLADVSADGPLPVFDADVVRITSAGDEDLLLSTADTVYGGRLENTDLVIGWSRSARLRDVLLVADRVLAEVVSANVDGTDFAERAPTFVLDARSGEVITEAGGDLRSTDLVGVVNGLVVPRAVSSSTRLVGVALDGTDLWQLPPGEVVAIGDEVVVTIETNGLTSVVRAYAAA